MDVTMKDEEKLLRAPLLSDYVNQYGGHQRFSRLFSIIDKANQGRVSEQLLTQVVNMGYQMAAAESNLGMYQRMQYAVGQHFKSVGKPVPGALSGTPAKGINLTQL